MYMTSCLSVGVARGKFKINKTQGRHGGDVAGITVMADIGF